MSDGSSQTPDADSPTTDPVASAASNGSAVRQLIGRPGAGAGLLAGIAGAAVALAFGELIDGLVDTIPSLVVAVGEALVDYSPDWAVKLSIELFGEKDKAVLAIGIVGVSLIIGGLLGACAMASRRRWVPIAGFAAFGVIGGWTAARNPMSPFVGSWIVAVIAAALGYVTLRMLLRLAPAHSPAHSDDQPPLEPAAGKLRTQLPMPADGPFCSASAAPAWRLWVLWRWDDAYAAPRRQRPPEPTSI